MNDSSFEGWIGKFCSSGSPFPPTPHFFMRAHNFFSITHIFLQTCYSAISKSECFQLWWADGWGQAKKTSVFPIVKDTSRKLWIKFRHKSVFVQWNFKGLVGRSGSCRSRVLTSPAQFPIENERVPDCISTRFDFSSHPTTHSPPPSPLEQNVFLLASWKCGHLCNARRKLEHVVLLSNQYSNAFFEKKELTTIRRKASFQHLRLLAHVECMCSLEAVWKQILCFLESSVVVNCYFYIIVKSASW